MEAKTKVKLLSLEPYRRLFPRANGKVAAHKRDATVHDTVNVIPKVVAQTGWQVKEFVDAELRGLPLFEALKKLWWWVKLHIEYQPDPHNVETVQTARHLIMTGKGDCDCYTCFIDTCLRELGVRGIINRITGYKNNNYYQHIYPIVPVGGRYVVMDCVVDKFNYEEPYTKKKDYNMDLQILDGIDEAPILGIDANNLQQLFGYESELAELGRLLKKRTPEQKHAAKEKRKKIGKKLLNAANKVNAGAVLLRAGILASMKLNLMKVAESLKWAYASRELAQSKGMDMSKYDKLKAVMAKAQNIFYLAGGKEDNLRKTILTGRGNRHHEVAGLAGMNEYTPLPQLLGAIYADEFVNGMDDYHETNGLGVVSETAAIASATSAMAALAALLKSIGNLFPHKKEAVADPVPPDSGADSTSEAAHEDSADASGSEGEENAPLVMPHPAPGQGDDTKDDDPPPDEDSGNNLPAPASETALTITGDSDPPADDDPSSDQTTQGLSGIADFYETNKGAIWGAGIVLGVFGMVALFHHIVSKLEPPLVMQPQMVNGVPRRKKKGGAKKNENGRQSVIALM